MVFPGAGFPPQRRVEARRYSMARAFGPGNGSRISAQSRMASHAVATVFRPSPRGRDPHLPRVARPALQNGLGGLLQETLCRAGTGPALSLSLHPSGGGLQPQHASNRTRRMKVGLCRRLTGWRFWRIAATPLQRTGADPRVCPRCGKGRMAVARWFDAKSLSPPFFSKTV